MNQQPNDDDVVMSQDDIAQMGLPPVVDVAAALRQQSEQPEDPALDTRLLDEASYNPAAEPPAGDDVTAEEEEGAPRYFIVAHQRVNLRPESMSSNRLPLDTPVDIRKTIPLPASTLDGLIECLSGNPNTVDPKWLELMNAARRLFPAGNEQQAALSRPGSVWTNRVVNEAGKSLAASRIRAGEENSKDLRSDRASLALRSFLDLGTIATFPLWNSGIWLNVRDPGDAALQELMRRQVSERGRLGRETHAVAYNNSMVHTVETTMELVLQSIASQSVAADVNLLEHISIHDFSTIVWGLASAVYSNGFNYSRACSHAADKCNTIVQETMNLNRMNFADQTRLTKEQILHMSNAKKNWATAADLVRYRDQFTHNLGYQIEVKGKSGRGLKFDLQVPTIAEALDAGTEWVSAISAQVTLALGLDADNEQRNNYQNDLARVTSAGRFSQWIKAIHVGNSSIVDRQAIKDAMYRDISSDSVLLMNLITEIEKFSTNSLVSVIGVLNYTCPGCGQPQMKSDDPAAPDDLPLVIAIDPMSVFFELMYRRFLEIQQRV